jgi:ribosomal protein L28
MNVCYHCGKGIIFGRRHTHHRGVAGGRWKKRAPKTRRIFEPNLQHVDIVENREEKRVKLCTKCLKRIKKDIREGKRPFLILKTIVDRKSRIDKEDGGSKMEITQSSTL